MYTLPHQCEFLSDAWLNEVCAFLSQEVRQRKDRLQGPFCVSERFTNAPDHLKFPDNVAQWAMLYDGEKVTVCRDFNPEAFLQVEGDYQAALTAAQMVGIHEPHMAKHMMREVTQLYGKEAICVKGGLNDPVANEIMVALHDHMGRVTVENPDLCHRAWRMGLSGKIREMEEQGYTIIENAISPEFADEVRENTLHALRQHNTQALQWMLYQGRPQELLAQNPKLMTLIDASLGRGAVIASLSSIRKGPGPGFIPIHTDYAHVPEPYPEFAMTGVGVWALEDWTEASGPTWLVPGSHKMRRAPRPGEGHNQGVPIVMPKGSAVFFTHGVWHWQGDRTTPGERVTLHMHFNRGILRSLEPKKTDEQLLHRNAPRLGEMLGLDDWFDKMDGIGRDHTRFMHMLNLHKFTDERKKMVLDGVRSEPATSKSANGHAAKPNGNGGTAQGHGNGSARANGNGASRMPSDDAKAIMASMSEGFARLEKTLERVAGRA